ncbi:hypothetical protein RJT34_12816 [Clitoria ternatea]|uniref:Uncharacterized protein n=1 Tax=Clitoria ternatea TaxID=43366 RepID=A0AAN9PLA3_CLITE
MIAVWGVLVYLFLMTILRSMRKVCTGFILEILGNSISKPSVSLLPPKPSVFLLPFEAPCLPLNPFISLHLAPSLPPFKALHVAPSFPFSGALFHEVSLHLFPPRALFHDVSLPLSPLRFASCVMSSSLLHADCIPSLELAISF